MGRRATLIFLVRESETPRGKIYFLQRTKINVMSELSVKALGLVLTASSI
jgi:hypothetical protein